MRSRKKSCRRGRAVPERTSPLVAAALIIAFWTLASATSRAQGSVSAEIRAFDRFVTTNAPLCLHEAAAACIDAAWFMADRNRDQLLSLEELTTVQGTLADWARWRKPSLHEKDWSGIQLGLLLTRAIGLQRLFEGFDADRDQGLSQHELLADVTLDQRPLPQILTDRSAVDWDAVSRRLGSFAGLVDGAVDPD